jgi:hypothetical protein
VADGMDISRAWAVAPGGSDLTCLFELGDPGPFQWGPRADRVVVGGLQVLGVGSNAARPSGSIQSGPLSWGRPHGLALVFVDSSGRHLDKAPIGNGSVSDITPLPSQRFTDVVYHPSGLAIAFVANGGEGSAIFMSSNEGTDPKRLVFTMMGTRFGPIAFDPDGIQLYYAARLAGGANMLAAYDLNQGKAAEHLWEGSSPVLKVLPRPRGRPAVLLDVGSGCSDRRAVLSDLGGGTGTPALPDAGDPTTGLGWLDAGHVLVGEGPCEQPMKLWIVGVDASASPTSQTLLFQGAAAASVRVPDRLPTPGLPDIGVPSGFA